MQKVRWTQKCAGGCGQTLTIGTRATRLHGGFFCDHCLAKHRVTCQVLTRYGERDPAR
jgi:hypothetical protein